MKQVKTQALYESIQCAPAILQIRVGYEDITFADRNDLISFTKRATKKVAELSELLDLEVDAIKRQSLIEIVAEKQNAIWQATMLLGGSGVHCEQV